MKATKLTVDLPDGVSRIETGPIKFNDDWTGIFIRGDNAGYYAFLLDALLSGKELDAFTKASLKGLQRLLASSNENVNHG